MRVWTKVWIAIVTACVVLTVYEIPNAIQVGRFFWLMWKDCYTASGKQNVPAIVTDRLIAADPEAGDMLRYCLRYSYENPNMDELAALAEKWPQNEFFLSQLAEELTRDTVTDSQAALVLVDRLLELNAYNAHYRYLRGGIFLMDPNRLGRPQAALEQFESGHRQPQFYLPYSKYKERVERLYEKASLFLERSRLRLFYMDLARYIFHSSQLRAKLDDNTFRDLSDSVVPIADRIIESAYDSETLLAGAALLADGQVVRLRNLDLPEAEAQQSRFRLARSLALMKIDGQLFASDVNAGFNFAWIVFVPLILFWTSMPFLLGIVGDFIQARLDRAKPKVCNVGKAYILIDIGLFLILVLLVVLEFLKKRPEGELPTFLLVMAVLFASWGAMGLSDIIPINLARLRRLRLWVAVLCGSLWFKGVVFWTAGSLSVAMPDHLIDWLKYVGILLVWTVLCVLVWIEASYRSDTFKSKRRNSVALIAYWVVVLMIFDVFGFVYVPIDCLTADPLARYRPLPGATQETYNRVILGQEPGASLPGRGFRVGVWSRLKYAAPKDLEAFIAGSRAADQRISEKNLQELLRGCSRDLRPILLDELADPNAYEVLVARAEWGDRSVKNRLERIYQERLVVFSEAETEPPRRGSSSLGELLELAGTLACISDGPEGQERLSYLVERVVERTRSLGLGPKLTDPRYAERIMLPFWESLGKLPKGYAAKFVKSYLRQTRYVDFFGDRWRDIGQLAALLADGDGELAEEVVVALTGLPVEEKSPNVSAVKSGYKLGMRLARYREKNSPHCLEAVFTNLSADSIPMLLEHLDSDNDQLRAFIVWRVTSLGYEWPGDQLQGLLKDDYWKVRLNTIFALDEEYLMKALDDENAVVRIVARIRHQAQ